MTEHHDAVAHTLAGETADYTALSRGFAAVGDVRKAVLTQWAADLRVLQSLLWENGLGEAPDATEGLLAIAEALEASWSQHGAHLRGADSARDLVERARVAMAAVFDPSVHPLLADRLTPLDHLTDVGHGGARPTVEQTYRQGRSPHELLRDLRTAGRDAVRVARALAGEHPGESDHQMWQAALAMFEAALVRSALSAGDAELVSAELRWELARGRLAEAGEPADAEDLRSGLTSVLGPLERGMVEEELDDLDRLPEDGAP